MSDFTPVLWPEDIIPAEAQDCQKCELCRQRTEIVWGEGNPKAPILILLDNPGARRDKEGNEFVCGSRRILQSAAYEAKLKPEDLYVTYILKCRPTRRYDKENTRCTCFSYLVKQIEEQQPKLVFCLGNTSVRYFFDDREAQVKELRGRWHNVRGLPTLVSYHPMAINRRPNLRRIFQQDWNALAAKFV